MIVGEENGGISAGFGVGVGAGVGVGVAVGAGVAVGLGVAVGVEDSLGVDDSEGAGVCVGAVESDGAGVSVLSAGVPVTGGSVSGICVSSAVGSGVWVPVGWINSCVEPGSGVISGV